MICNKKAAQLSNIIADLSSPVLLTGFILKQPFKGLYRIKSNPMYPILNRNSMNLFFRAKPYPHVLIFVIINHVPLLFCYMFPFLLSAAK